MHNQRRANVGAEHHGKCRHQVYEAAGCEASYHKASGRAALHDSRHTNTGQKRLEAVAKGSAQEASELCSEDTLHASLDHVHPPQQERNGAGEVEQGEGEVHGPLPFCLMRPALLIARPREGRYRLLGTV